MYLNGLDNLYKQGVIKEEEYQQMKLEISKQFAAQRAQIEDIVKRKTGIAPENIVITPLKESEDAEDTTQTDETSADTSYEEDSETSAQPYEDTAIDTTDIYD